jgi:hypothetical protein
MRVNSLHIGGTMELYICRMSRMARLCMPSGVAEGDGQSTLQNWNEHMDQIIPIVGTGKARAQPTTMRFFQSPGRDGSVLWTCGSKPVNITVRLVATNTNHSSMYP